MPPRIDITGQRFNKWLVLEFTEYWYTASFYRCQCDCGTIKEVSAYNLKAGLSKSCGSGTCRNRDRYLDTPAYYGGSFSRVYISYKTHATQKGLAFELDCHTFYTMSQASCYYCGIEKYSCYTHRICEPLAYNGIDRVDNTLGYTKENTVTCCGLCNHAKHTMGQQDFIDLCKRIASHHS